MMSAAQQCFLQYVAPDTGDNNDLVLWIILAVVAALILIVGIVLLIRNLRTASGGSWQLKAGYSKKGTGSNTGRSEQTVRQQDISVQQQPEEHKPTPEPKPAEDSSFRHQDTAIAAEGRPAVNRAGYAVVKTKRPQDKYAATGDGSKFSGTDAEMQHTLGFFDIRDLDKEAGDEQKEFTDGQPEDILFSDQKRAKEPGERGIHSDVTMPAVPPPGDLPQEILTVKPKRESRRKKKENRQPEKAEQLKEEDDDEELLDFSDIANYIPKELEPVTRKRRKNLPDEDIEDGADIPEQTIGETTRITGQGTDDSGVSVISQQIKTVQQPKNRENPVDILPESAELNNDRQDQGRPGKRIFRLDD